MSIEWLTILMFGSMLLFLALGFPFAWVTGGLGVIFGFFLFGPNTFQLYILRIWDLMMNFGFVAIPLFVFMANVLRYAGIADDLYEAVYHWLGGLRGGLAMTTVAVCTVMAAMLGTAGGGIAIMGLIALPAMLQRKYNKGIALGSILAGGTLGVMIPPSIQFVLYGMFAGQSVGRLFIGGIGPGLVLSGLYITYIGVRSYLQRDLAPALPKEMRSVSLRQHFGYVRALILPIILILIVLGTIYGGVATPGEAAGIGAVGAMLSAGVRRRLNWGNLKAAVYATLRTTSTILWISFGAITFVATYQLAGGDAFMANIITGLELGPWLTLIGIQIILIIMGMFLDLISILVLTVPIIVPIITSLGFNPLWFGVLYNINMQIAYISPPFGYSLFYLKGVAPPEINTGDIYRSVWPFIILQIIGLALSMVFPQIILWLPSLM